MSAKTISRKEICLCSQTNPSAWTYTWRPTSTRIRTLKFKCTTKGHTGCCSSTSTTKRSLRTNSTKSNSCLGSVNSLTFSTSRLFCWRRVWLSSNLFLMWSTIRRYTFQTLSRRTFTHTLSDSTTRSSASPTGYSIASPKCTTVSRLISFWKSCREMISKRSLWKELGLFQVVKPCLCNFSMLKWSKSHWETLKWPKLSTRLRCKSPDT